MNYKKDTPSVGSIVGLHCGLSIFEAKVESRYLDGASAMEELKLSGGAIIRRDNGSGYWRAWLNGEVGEKSATVIEKMEIIS